MVGCQSIDESSKGHHSSHEMIMGDIREATVSAETKPAFLEHHHETIQDIYEQVPNYRDLLEQMPCYCGCGESVGHRNTYDCFIHEHKRDGSVVWDDHGAKCGVCLEIAHYSMELYDKGASIKEIRHFIDERYKEGYAKPTDTPSV
jgi:hypothetical protein